MGIFSSKKKTVIGTSVSRLIDDDLLPNSPVKGVLKAILQEGDIPPYVLEELSQNIGVRAERMYEYAGRNYIFGLPTGEFISSNSGRPLVQAVLDGLEGTTVNIEYSALGPPNILHIGWVKLIQNHGYNPATNRLDNLSTSKGTDVYLDKMEVVVPTSQVGTFDPGSLSQWGTSTMAGYSPSRPAQQYAPGLSAFAADLPIVQSSTATEDFARVTAAWNGPNWVDQPDGSRIREVLTETFNITNSEFDDEADYFHVKYTAGGVVKYWMYRLGAGTYPSLDELFNAPAEVSGEFFPFLHFRGNKTSMDADVDSDEYKHSVKMSKYLGLDYQSLLDSINENPDIAQVENSYLTFAVPPDSEDPLELRYLFDFFAQLFDAGQGGMGAVTSTFQFSLSSLLLANRPESLIQIEDGKIKVSLANTGIYRRRLPGSIGPVGTHNRSIDFINRGTVPVGNSNSFLHLVNARPITSHTYRRQVSENVYEEVQVLGLVMRYQVEGDHWTGGDADTDEDILLVPLDRSITRNYKITDREVLYARSLHLVFNSLQVVTVKWYQRGAWSTLMKIAAIVILIISVGQAFKEAMAAWAAAQSLSAAAWAAFTVLVENIVTGILVSQAFQIFVKLVGVDLAVTLALVAAVFGAYKVMEAGSFKAAIPSAKTMLQISSSLIKAATTVTSGLIGDLLTEMSAFEKEMKEQMKLLDEANELLQTNNLLEPFTIFGERPEDYYQRTVHSGNVGTIGFEALHNYVENALTLPTISETLGGPIDVQL